MNEGKIINKGSLTIQNIFMKGYVGSLNSTFTNEGNVHIADITLQGFDLNNGMMHNKSGATITIDNTMLECMRLVSGALLQPDGILNLNQ